MGGNQQCCAGETGTRYRNHNLAKAPKLAVSGIFEPLLLTKNKCSEFASVVQVILNAPELFLYVLILTGGNKFSSVRNILSFHG